VVRRFYDLKALYDRKKDKLLDFAYKDPLTGLYNRRFFEEKIETEFARCKRYQRQLQLAMLDLDHFKLINDTFGHNRGDQLLQTMSHRMLACVRETDTVCRHAGDEYLIVLSALREPTEAATERGWSAYQDLLAKGKYKRMTAKPGDVLPILGMDAVVASADGAVLDHPLPRAGEENPACKGAEQYPVDQTENLRSLGTVITFGKLRILDLGDLTHDKEMELMCPQNKLGKIDIYIVSHHGFAQSSSLPFVYGLAPRVAIMDNGAKKGGSPSVLDGIRKSPGLDDLWQLHFSEEGGTAHNVATEFIANPDGPDAANDLELTANPDGSFEVSNSRTQKSKNYPAR